MNEFIFFLHLISLVGFIYVGLRYVPYGLILLSALQVILANLFVTKQICLFGFTVTPTDAYALGCFLSFNLIQEFYGKGEAKKMMRLNLFILAFFAVMACIQVIYLPSPFDEMHGAFASILTPSLRIFLASTVCFVITQRLDFHLFGFLRTRLSLTKAMFLSLAITQAFDTVAFSILGLSSFAHNLWHIIFISYLVKMITLALMASFTRIFQKAVA